VQSKVQTVFRFGPAPEDFHFCGGERWSTAREHPDFSSLRDAAWFVWRLKQYIGAGIRAANRPTKTYADELTLKRATSAAREVVTQLARRRQRLEPAPDLCALGEGLTKDLCEFWQDAIWQVKSQLTRSRRGLITEEAIKAFLLEEDERRKSKQPARIWVAANCRPDGTCDVFEGWFFINFCRVASDASPAPRP
jgi:hypothetical protein